MNTVTSKLGQFLRALALLGLIAVVIPWVLVAAADARFGGPAPWSASPPLSDWGVGTVWSAVTDRMSETTLADIVIRLGLAIAWIAVVVVIATVVAELVHMLRHRGLAMPPVRGLGVSQSVARVIASGLLVVVPMFVSPSRAVAHDAPLAPEGRAPAGHDAPRPANVWLDEDPLAVDDSPTSVADRLAPADPSQASATATEGTYVVRSGDSVYGIAARIAGPDPSAITAFADRVLELNLDRQMNDGQWFTNAAYIDIGWELRLPAADPSATEPSGGPGVEAGVETVEAGESLWSIAEDRLGAGERWPEIYALNEGRQFDDGRTLHDPDLIHPGWQLDLPAAAPEGAPATGAPTDVVEEAPIPSSEVPPDESVDGGVVEQTGEVGEVGDVGDVGGEGVAVAVPTAEDASARPENVWLTPPDADRAAAALVASEQAPVESGPAAPTVAPVIGGESATEDASGVELLTFERAAMLSAGVLALLAVRRRATMRRAPPNSRLSDPQPAVVATERALRSIDPGERFARVDIAIRHAAVTLIDRASRVEAVAVADDGAIELWVSGAAPLATVWEPVDDSLRRWRLPAATPIEMLVDDARRVGAPCPTLVQLGRDVEDRDVYVDLEALEALEVGGPGADADAVVNAVAATLAASVFAEVTTLIGVGVPDEAFLGHRHHRPVRDVQRAFEEAADAIGTTATTERSTFELRARVTSGETWEPAVVLAGSAVGTITAPRRRTGLALVSASPIHGPSSRLAPDGDAWSLLPLGIRLVPIGLSAADVNAVASLATVPEPVPMRAERPVTGPDDTIVGFDGIGVEGIGFDDDLDDGAVAAIDRGAEVEPLRYELLVRLFGPVTIESRDGITVDFERSKTKELIAWLATHRERSTRSNARAALWELDVRDATFANVVSEARRALARAVEPPDGEEWVGRTMTDSLPLHPLVVTDLAVIEHALAAARLQPPDLAIATLRPAVDLVVGVPFEGTGYLWPDAEGITSELVLRAITLTNALAAHCLSVGDIDGVFAATSRGLQVLPAHEDMIAVRMRAYALAGDRAGVRHEWETYERAIVSDPWSDGEPSDRMVELRRELGQVSQESACPSPEIT